MSLIDEIEHDVESFAAATAAKIGSVDKAAYAKMEALQSNAGAMQLVDAALGYLHLPPEAFGAVVTVLGEVAKLYVPAQPAPAAPEPSFTPAGPQVGGQA